MTESGAIQATPGKVRWIAARSLRPVFAAAVVLAMAIVAIVGVGSFAPEAAAPLSGPSLLPGAERKMAGHADQAKKAEIDQRFRQGVAMLQIGQFEHALTAFHRVLVLEPELPEAHVNSGFALYELGRYAEAQRFFEGALALSPIMANAHYGFALARLAQGDPMAAEPAMRRYLELAPHTDGFRSTAESRLKDIVALASKQRRAMGGLSRRQDAR